MKHKFLLSLLALPFVMLTSCTGASLNGSSTNSGSEQDSSEDITSSEEGGSTNKDSEEAGSSEEGNTTETGGGESQGPDLEMHYTYQHYVDTYGYVGTEDEFYTDLGRGHIGTKKEYKVTISVCHHPSNAGPGMVNINDFETVVDNKTYKNGEQVIYDYHAAETKTHLVNVICDNYVGEDTFDLLNVSKIDLDDYRAYKDVHIFIIYDDYELTFDFHENIVNGTPYFAHLRLASYYTYHEFTDEEWQDVEINKLSGSVDFVFNNDDKTFTFLEKGYAFISIVYHNTYATRTIDVQDKDYNPHKGSTFEFKFNTKKENNNSYDHVEVGDIYGMSFYVVETTADNKEITYKYNDAYDILEIANIDYKYTSSNENILRIVEGSSFYAKSDGVATISAVDVNTNKILDTLEIKVYKVGEAPKIKAYFDVDHYFEDERKFAIAIHDKSGNQIQYTNFATLTLKPLFPKDGVTKYYDIQKNYGSYYVIFYEYGYYSLSYTDSFYEIDETVVHFDPDDRYHSLYIDIDGQQSMYYELGDVYYYPNVEGGEIAKIKIDHIGKGWNSIYVLRNSILVLDFSNVEAVKGVNLNGKPLVGVNGVYTIEIDGSFSSDSLIKLVLEEV